MGESAQRSDAKRTTKNSRKVASLEEQNKILEEVLKASKSGAEPEKALDPQTSKGKEREAQVISEGSERSAEKTSVEASDKGRKKDDKPPPKKMRKLDETGKERSGRINEFYDENNLILSYPGYETVDDEQHTAKTGSNRPGEKGGDVNGLPAGSRRRRHEEAQQHASASVGRSTQEHELSLEEEEELEGEEQYQSGDSGNEDFLGDGEWDNYSVASSAIFPADHGKARRGDYSQVRDVNVVKPGCKEGSSRSNEPKQNNGGVNKETVNNIIESLVKERVGLETAKDAVGPAVAECIAELLRTFLKEPNAEATLKLLESYPRPENVEWLKAPVMGPQVAASIPKKSNNYDKRLRQSQLCLGGGIAAMASVLQDILNRGKNDPSLAQLARKVMDAMTLTGYVHFDFNAIRKGAIRQVINPQYAGVFTRRTSSTPENLLGESSVPEQLKEYEEIGKVRAKLQKPRRGHDHRNDSQRGRGRGHGHPNNRGHFAGRGAGSHGQSGFGYHSNYPQQRGGRGNRPHYPQQRRVYGHQHQSQDGNSSKDQKSL